MSSSSYSVSDTVSEQLCAWQISSAALSFHAFGLNAYFFPPHRTLLSIKNPITVMSVWGKGFISKHYHKEQSSKQLQNNYKNFWIHVLH